MDGAGRRQSADLPDPPGRRHGAPAVSAAPPPKRWRPRRRGRPSGRPLDHVQCRLSAAVIRPASRPPS
jgi:hypothetical protein